MMNKLPMLLCLLFVIPLSSMKNDIAPIPVKEEVKWMSFDEAVKLNEDTPKLLFFDMYTDWCGWCKRMDASTFSNEVIAKALNKYTYAIKFDAEQKEDIIFKGKTYKFVANGRRGYHELAATLMNGKLSYPTVVFLTNEYQVLQSMPGYRDAKELERIIKFFGTEAYKNTQWEAYQADDSQFEIK